MQFIVPRNRSSVPRRRWGMLGFDEIKFDGWRKQLHNEGRSLLPYAKSDFSSPRFGSRR
jgi:hypothetical protein